MGFPIVVPTTSGGTGTTLQTYRRALADQLGFYQPATIAAATYGETTRIVLSSDLRDDEQGYAWMGAPYVYVVDGAQAGQQRRVISQPEVGYQASDGVMLVSRPFAVALAAGTGIEVTSPLPVKRTLATKGLNECVNEALAMIWVEARVNITGNGTNSYDLSGMPWITQYEQIRGVYDTLWSAATEANTLSPFGYRIVADGAGRSLVTQLSYSTADTFDMSVLVRGDMLVSDGSTWEFTSSPGLLNDSYQGAAPERWVTAFGMVRALQHLSRLTMLDKTISQQDRQLMLADLRMRRTQWATAAAQIKLQEFPRPLAERPVPIGGFSNLRGGWN